MNNSSLNTAATPQQALIFIPDICGFTRFVADTEVSHAKHIIEELLEILIDSNKIGLEVSEIEGDAILFYRFGKAPSAKDLLDQVKAMFSNFHLHLKKYETHRVCNCGACSTAHNLAVKFVAHYGDVTMNTIRQYKKLFGKDVIVAHRLLKNDIDSSEYSLFTDSLRDAHETWQNVDQDTWSSMEYAEHEYDSGKVGFSYVSLIPLRDELPDPVADDYSLKGMKSKMLDFDYVIEAPLETVFDVVADINFRSKWIPGTMEVVTDVNTELVQAGQSHKCIADGPVLFSHDYKVTDQMVTFTETDDKKTHCVVYTFKKLDEKKTQVHTSLFLKSNFMKETMFKLMMRSKLQKAFLLSIDNLKKYCEELARTGAVHPYQVQLGRGKEAYAA